MDFILISFTAFFTALIVWLFARSKISELTRSITDKESGIIKLESSVSAERDKNDYFKKELNKSEDKISILEREFRIALTEQERLRVKLEEANQRLSEQKIEMEQ